MFFEKSILQDIKMSGMIAIFLILCMENDFHNLKGVKNGPTLPKTKAACKTGNTYRMLECM